MNYGLRLNLLALQGSFTTNMQGKNATKLCLVIPIADASLYLGQKGCYIDLSAIEVRNPGDNTHILKQRLDKATYNAMTEEERSRIPIMGNMRPFTPKSAPNVETMRPEDCDDLPF